MSHFDTRTLRRLLPLSTALLVTVPALAGQPAYAPDAYGAGDPWSAPDGDLDAEAYDLAQVLRAEPQVHSVRIVEPRQECRTEVRYVPVRERRGAVDTGAATFVGGVLGAVVGHQIGQREARGVGTVAGALIGGAIGHEMAQGQVRRAGETGYRGEELHAVQSEQCVTRALERWEDRIDGYRVTYRYNGHIYSTQLPRDPGATLRVRVNVQPVG
jgi:uncharacterized protein YcfJ